jgi:hypothetical protein
MQGKAKIAAMAFTCAASIAPTAVTGAAESTADLIKSTQEEWVRCLRDAYPFYAKKTPGQNYAAEMTFGACSVYEEKLRTFSSETGVSRSAFEKLKAATKKSFIGAK